MGSIAGMGSQKEDWEGGDGTIGTSVELLCPCCGVQFSVIRCPTHRSKSFSKSKSDEALCKQSILPDTYIRSTWLRRNLSLRQNLGGHLRGEKNDLRNVFFGQVRNFVVLA